MCSIIYELQWILVFIIPYIIIILASTYITDGEYVVYSGGHLRTPPGEKWSSGQDEKKVAGTRTKGCYLTLITGKGNNTKTTSK